MMQTNIIKPNIKELKLPDNDAECTAIIAKALGVDATYLSDTMLDFGTEYAAKMWDKVVYSKEYWRWWAWQWWQVERYEVAQTCAGMVQCPEYNRLRCASATNAEYKQWYEQKHSLENMPYYPNDIVNKAIKKPLNK
jgi:hypothetical protein